MMRNDDELRADLDTRAAALTVRAETKYGPTAISPKGDERFDVFDYCINELAGVPRYVEMMLNRLDDMDMGPITKEQICSILSLVGKTAVIQALELHRVRESLIGHGNQLGVIEEL